MRNGGRRTRAAWTSLAAIVTMGATAAPATPTADAGRNGWSVEAAGVGSRIWIHGGRQGAPTLVYMKDQGETIDDVIGTTLAAVAQGWTVVVPMALADMPARQARIALDAVRDVKDADLIIRSNGTGAAAALEAARRPHAFIAMTSPVIEGRDATTLIGNAARSPGQVLWSQGPRTTPETGAEALADELGLAYRRIDGPGGRIGHLGDSITREQDGIAFGRRLVTLRLP